MVEKSSQEISQKNSNKITEKFINEKITFNMCIINAKEYKI